MNVDLIVVSSGNGATAAKSVTQALPVIFFVDDPVKLGLVASFSRPGGNMTGMSFAGGAEFAGNLVQLLKEAVPGSTRVALMSERAAASATGVKDWQDAAKALGVKLKSFEVRDVTELDRAFDLMSKDRVNALIVRPSPLTVRFRARIVDLAARHRLPAMYGFGEFARAGGLIAYGANVPAVFRRQAYYVDRILRGAQPGDLPVEQPTKFDLVINLKTAKALGLTIPPSLLLRADQVIE